MDDAPAPGFGFDDSHIEWRQFRALDGVYYHLLDVDETTRTVDWLMKFEPDKACVLHRHTGPCKTFVLEGEHHVFEPDGNGGYNTVVRPAGTWATSTGDNVHFESGGPGGGVIYLSMTGADETIYDILDDELNLERSITVADFHRGLEKQRAQQG